MTEASQLTKPRPTQQTAAGSPLYTNKLLQALAVTFQVSFFTYLRWKGTYHSTYLWILILFQVGLFLFVGPLSLAFFVYLCYTDYYLVSLCYLCWYFWDFPTPTNGGRSGHLVSWMRWTTMYLCSIKFLLKHICKQSLLFLKGLGLYGSTTRPTTLFLWSRPLSWTPRRIISSPAILMAYSALELWYVNLISQF